MSASTLLVSEVYASVQGESSHAGRPCTFVRLSGCPLRCRWCDSVFSYKGGVKKSVAELLDDVAKLGTKLVEVTGGEPLAQPGAIPLMEALVAADYEVLLETSGAYDISALPEAVRCILDVKCPGSGMSERMDWENLARLRAHDEVKFVIADRADFDWAVERVREFRIPERACALFSPVFEELAPATLVEWMHEAKLSDVRLNLQIHKYIWEPDARGV